MSLQSKPSPLSTLLLPEIPISRESKQLNTVSADKVGEASGFDKAQRQRKDSAWRPHMLRGEFKDPVVWRCDISAVVHTAYPLLRDDAAVRKCAACLRSWDLSAD